MRWQAATRRSSGAYRARFEGNPNTFVSIVESPPRLKLDFEYDYAFQPPTITGCSPVAGQPPDGFRHDDSGSGFYRDYLCEFRNGLEIKISLIGLRGGYNTKTETYHVQCDDPELTFTNGAVYDDQGTTVLCPAQGENWWAVCPYEGKIRLTGTVTRTCTVRRQTNEDPVDTKEIPWVKFLEIEALSSTGDGEVCGTSGSKGVDDDGVTPEDGKLRLVARLDRTESCHSYRFKVTDPDDQVFYSHLKEFAYEPPPEEAFGLMVSFQTGEHDGAGTDADISIKFCPTSNFDDDNCTMKFRFDPYDDEGNRFENGDYNYQVFSEGFGGGRSVDDLRYFRIKLKNRDDDNPDWLLTGLKVEYMDINGEWKKLYVNPCVNRYLAPDEQAYFGPNDLAVCAVLETGTEEGSGTDGDIFLVFPVVDSFKNTSANTDAPWFSRERNFFGNSFLRLHLDWGEYDDHENGDKTTYGASFFEGDPIGRQCHFEHLSDDGWLLQAYELWVFKPGDPLFLGDWKCDHIKGRPHSWIEEETSLRYPRSQDQQITANQDCSILQEISIEDESVGGFL